MYDEINLNVLLFELIVNYLISQSNFEFMGASAAEPLQGALLLVLSC